MLNAPHWGSWVLHRSQFVGFRTRRQLSESVGCQYERLCRWLKMAGPPIFRKGFAGELARSLKTDRRMLLREWQLNKPESVGTVDTPPDREVPWLHEYPDDEKMRENIRELTWLLNGEDLRAIYRAALDRFGANISEREKRLSELRSAGLSLPDATRRLPARLTGRRPKRA
jgi:hypothetical protein